MKSEMLFSTYFFALHFHIEGYKDKNDKHSYFYYFKGKCRIGIEVPPEPAQHLTEFLDAEYTE